MALTETLRDNFDVDRLASLWSFSFGAVSVTNGRAQIPTDTGYAALQSDATYTFNNSYVFAQMFMPAAGGATTEAFAELTIQSGTGGTDIIFGYNAVTNLLTMANRAGYFDGGATTLAYNSTTHRWLKMSITGGNILWDTAPDGLTWTNRRTAAASAWATSGTTLYVMIQSHRNDGTNDFAEVENFNNIPKACFPKIVNTVAMIRASTR
jgi:hypothetical protein